MAGCRKAPQRVEPTPTPTPAPTPTPPPYVPNKRLDTGRIFNGMQYRMTLETEFGSTASVDREDPASYRAELLVKVRVPKPHRNLEEISRLNDRLPVVLPELARLISGARISPFFDELYRLKVSNLRSNMSRLDALLTRHNFYDTETVLELQHPETHRRAVLIQSDMDVDEDGSDPERVPEVDGSSVTFLPFTSYRWERKTSAVNSFLTPRNSKLRQYEKELAGSGLPPVRVTELKESVARLKSEIGDLKKYSFLVAKTDPYVVVPGSMAGKSKGAFGVEVGDYCVVIHGGVLYPAIVGDVGPAYKAGEGSLRLCQQINAKANTNFRAVSDLKVTYLVFPGSGERPWRAPDLDRWRERCEGLLTEIGGHQGELFVWENLVKPIPSAPVPVPSAQTPGTPVVAPVTPVSGTQNPAASSSNPVQPPPPGGVPVPQTVPQPAAVQAPTLP